MDKFRDAYRQAAERLPKFHMDVSQAGDELHHRRLMLRRRQRLVARGCSVLCLLCGTGVAAKNYHDSVIQMRQNGFVITDEENAARARSMEDSMGAGGYALQADGLDDGGGMADTGVGATRDQEGGGVLSPDDVEVIDMEPVEYDSVEAFREQDPTPVAIPSREQFSISFEEEQVLVLEGGRHIYVRYMGEEGYFCLSQQDNREYEGYSSSVAYMGEVANERSYTNRQGVNFTMFDTVEQGSVDAVHAVVSLNGRDLVMDFKGIAGQEVEKILDTLDMTVYFGQEQ